MWVIVNDNMTESKQGFTRIELLVVVGIIGLLSVLATVALNSARERSRDAKRLADVARTQVALEFYFNDHNSYPVATTALPLGQPITRCLSSSGFIGSCDPSSESVYMERVPTTPEAGLKESVACGGVQDAYCYVGNTTSYRIQFELENDNPEAKLVSGVNCASESGVEAGACEAL